jgi:ribosomal protein S18 acetylase RimI-like enzyme
LQSVSNPSLDLRAFPGGAAARPLTVADAPELARVDNAHARRWTGSDRRGPDEWRMQLERPGVDLQRDSIGVFTTKGRLLGFATAVNPAQPYNESITRVMVDDEGLGHDTPREPREPEPREPQPGEAHPGEHALLEWALEVQRSRLPEAPDGIRVVTGMGVLAADLRTRKLIASYGFRTARYFLHMRIDMDAEPEPVPVPTGIAVSTLAETRNLDAVALAFDDAFRDHFGYTEQPRDELLAEWHYMVEQDPYADPTLCFVAFDGTEIAGFCMNRSRTGEDPDMGYVAVLGVRRPWRKRGLGLALLTRSFVEFYRRGRRSVGLNVDADSLTGATRLYEKAGMREDRRFIFAELVLREGTDIRRSDESQEQT